MIDSNENQYSLNTIQGLFRLLKIQLLDSKLQTLKFSVQISCLDSDHLYGYRWLIHDL